MRNGSGTFRNLIVGLALVLAMPAGAGFGVGDALPDSLGKDRDGNELSLAAQHGKVVVMTFWASWCGYCLQELPILESLQRRVGKEHIEVVAINVDKTYRDFIALRRRLKDFELDITRDANEHLADAYGVKGLPHMVLVDKQGRMAFTHVGYSEKSLPNFVNEINGLLNENVVAAHAQATAR